MRPLVVALALSLGGAAVPAAAEEMSAAAAPLCKKQRLLADKAASPPDPVARAAHDRVLARRVGKPPDRIVNVVNTWTDETLVLAAEGQVALGADVVDRFLRCHFTNQPARMDARLFDTLVKAARTFGARKVEIVSGFRAPKYNLMLRKRGHEVARDSQHTKGHAVDFRLPGVPVARLRAWAMKLRLGGVGYYPGSGFVHVDIGPVRQWGGD